VTADRLLHELPLPGPAFPDLSGFALSADGTTVAAVVPGGDDKPGRVIIWDLTTGARLAELPAEATAVVLSPDGRFVASGDEGGTVRVWPLPSGEPVVIESGGTRIRSLAFGRSAQRENTNRPGDGWVLATGHAGGAVIVWDVRSRRLLSHCVGGAQDTLALAFSPDGTTLAGAGRYHPRLWDVRTGQLLLKLATRVENWQTGLAFSPDGRFLAVAGVTIHGFRGGAEVWELEPGRGIRELRGLSGTIAQVRFSADGRRVAAMSHHWEVAAWDTDAGRLLFRAPTPQGRYPKDHAALTLDPSGDRVACGAGRGVRVWSAEGTLIRAHDLPPGFGDALTFLPSGELLSVRFETQGKDRYPEGPAAHPAQHPRTIRARELSESGPRLLHEFRDLPWSIHAVEIGSDGRFAVANGLTEHDQNRLVVFDPLAGRVLWSSLLDPWPGRQFFLDAAGECLWHFPRGGGPLLSLLRVDTLTGRVLDPVHRPFHAPLSRGGELVLGVPEGSGPNGIALLPYGSTVPLLRFNADELGLQAPRFAPRGERLGWGRGDGSVMIADLPEVRRRLTEIGLGW
jgi:WD40 repeat protein